MCKILAGETYGFQASVWENAKLEAVRAIVQEGKKGKTIAYSDLTKRISSIGFGPHDYSFHHLLGEISCEEEAAGRGMLSALVVHKEDGMPGQGFFDLARQLGRDVTDQLKCWSEEVTTVLGKCKVH